MRSSSVVRSVLLGAVAALALAACSSPAASPSGTATSSAGSVVARTVTTGPGIPDATSIDDAALAGVGSGWVLTMFDTGRYDEHHNPVLGPRLMYLVSPDGHRYQAGYFGHDRAADILAWNVARHTVLMRFNGAEIGVFDLVTGRLAPTWSPCGPSYVDVRVRPRPDGNWEFRGACAGAQLDGVYAADGTLVDDPSFVPQPFGTWSTDIGGTTVVVNLDTHAWTATAAQGGAPVALQMPPAAAFCTPIADGRGVTVTASCSGPVGISVWEIDSGGGPAVEVAMPAQIDPFSTEFAGGAGGMQVTDFATSCAVGNVDALVVRSVTRAVGLTGGANLEPVFLHPHQPATDCWGATGATGLYSAEGSLWTYDATTDTTVPLIEVDALTDPTPLVGTSLTRSIIVP